MELRVLGPLEVTDGAAPLALGGRKPRALLARLALDANRTVAVQRLVHPGQQPRRHGRAPRGAPARARTERFAVNVLGAQHAGFARRAATPGADRFAGAVERGGGLPVLRDAVAVLECDIDAELAGAFGGFRPR